MFQGKGLLKYIISALIDKETDEIYECANIHFIDEGRIEAHFLTYFVSLLLLRLI